MNVNATNDLVSECGNTLTRNSVTIPKLPPYSDGSVNQIWFFGSDPVIHF